MSVIEYMESFSPSPEHFVDALYKELQYKLTANELALLEVLFQNIGYSSVSEALLNMHLTETGDWTFEFENSCFFQQFLKHSPPSEEIELWETLFLRMSIVLSGFFSRYISGKKEDDNTIPRLERMMKVYAVENFMYPETPKVIEFLKNAILLHQIYQDDVTREKDTPSKFNKSDKIKWLKSPDELISLFDDLLRKGEISDPLNRNVKQLPFAFFQMLNPSYNFQSPSDISSSPVIYEGLQKQLLFLFSELIHKKCIPYPNLNPPLLEKISNYFVRKNGTRFTVKYLQSIKNKHGIS